MYYLSAFIERQIVSVHRPEVMNTERWQQIKKIFHAAMEVEPERRSTYVADACGEDTDLRFQVESLLAADRNSDQFIRRKELARRALQETIIDDDPMIGREVGSYRIERLLGHGGMGTVYFARRLESENDPIVAIKMVSRGMDTAAVIRRF